jgi:hypothetical protein
MIVMIVIGSVIVAGLAWAGWDDYRRRRRGARHSVTAAFKRQAETDRQRISESAPGGDTTGGGVEAGAVTGVRRGCPHRGNPQALGSLSTAPRGLVTLQA